VRKVAIENQPSAPQAEWIEIVRLLGAPLDVETLQQGIRAQLDDLQKTPGLVRALVMLHAAYGTDFAIVLVWKDQREPAKTREGLLLADCLQHFGSVDHAVWTVLPAMPERWNDKGVAQKSGEGTVKGRS
jgi:hypothetical protein